MTSGIPNFVAVDEALKIYRGGQPPNKEAWDYIKGLGVTQVIQLNTAIERRMEDGTDADAYAASIGMQVMQCPITLTRQILPWFELKNLGDAVAFIAPGTFVHCGSVSRTQHAILLDDDKDAGGNDRTGAAILCYRVLHMGWTLAAAWDEALALSFHWVLFGLRVAIEHLTKQKQ